SHALLVVATHTTLTREVYRMQRSYFRKHVERNGAFITSGYRPVGDRQCDLAGEAMDAATS
ncbi:hypothetical protein BaRGS_00012293, partial [Batillaria attramentaria]